jgi:hypothetical protein
MATQVIWGTLAKISGGFNGTAPDMFAGSSDQTEAVITTAGAVADLYSVGIIKAGDVFYVNFDQDGTPGQNVYTVTATSGGSLITYPNAVGGALLAANNLSDVSNAATAAENLGLGLTDSPTFTGVTVSGYFFDSAANAITAFAGGGQGSATQLAKGVNRVTVVATAGDSVKLPAATAGKHVVVINADSAEAMDCFPASGEAINALSANTALSIVANKTVLFFCAVAGTWNSILTA